MDADRTTARIQAARSWLFTPGTKPAAFGKASDVGADAVIFDLEDAVAPADKDSARATVFEHLANPDEHVLRAVRINGVGTATGLHDLVELLQSKTLADAVVLPKVETGGVLDVVTDLLDEAGSPVRIIALIESARGVRDVTAILDRQPRLAALAVGAADLAADLGGSPTWEALLAARAAILTAASAVRIPVIDSPFFDPADPDGLHTETTQAATMGFTAKAAIHPNQIATINAAWTPTAKDVAWAKHVVSVNQAGVGTVDGAMVDQAVARRARRILHRIH